MFNFVSEFSMCLLKGVSNVVLQVQFGSFTTSEQSKDPQAHRRILSELSMVRCAKLMLQELSDYLARSQVILQREEARLQNLIGEIDSVYVGSSSLGSVEIETSRNSSSQSWM